MKTESLQRKISRENPEILRIYFNSEQLMPKMTKLQKIFEQIVNLHENIAKKIGGPSCNFDPQKVLKAMEMCFQEAEAERKKILSAGKRELTDLEGLEVTAIKISYETALLCVKDCFPPSKLLDSHQVSLK